MIFSEEKKKNFLALAACLLQFLKLRWLSAIQHTDLAACCRSVGQTLAIDTALSAGYKSVCSVLRGDQRKD